MGDYIGIVVQRLLRGTTVGFLTIAHVPLYKTFSGVFLRGVQRRSNFLEEVMRGSQSYSPSLGSHANTVVSPPKV